MTPQQLKRGIELQNIIEDLETMIHDDELLQYKSHTISQWPEVINIIEEARTKIDCVISNHIAHLREEIAAL